MVKVNKLLKILQRTLSLNEMVYTKTKKNKKTIRDKTGISLSNSIRNTISGLEKTLKESARTRESSKKEETHKNAIDWKDQKTTTAVNSDDKSGRDKSKDVQERKETQKIPWQGQAVQTKQELSK